MDEWDKPLLAPHLGVHTQRLHKRQPDHYVIADTGWLRQVALAYTDREKAGISTNPHALLQLFTHKDRCTLFVPESVYRESFTIQGDYALGLAERKDGSLAFRDTSVGHAFPKRRNLAEFFNDCFTEGDLRVYKNMDEAIEAGELDTMRGGVVMIGHGKHNSEGVYHPYGAGAGVGDDQIVEICNAFYDHYQKHYEQAYENQTHAQYTPLNLAVITNDFSHKKGKTPLTSRLPSLPKSVGKITGFPLPAWIDSLDKSALISHEDYTAMRPYFWQSALENVPFALTERCAKFVEQAAPEEAVRHTRGAWQK